MAWTSSSPLSRVRKLMMCLVGEPEVLEMFGFFLAQQLHHSMDTVEAVKGAFKQCFRFP